MEVLRQVGKYLDRHISRLFGSADRRQHQQHHYGQNPSPVGTGIDGSGGDGRRKRKRKGLKRTQSGFQSIIGTEKAARRWPILWWRRQKVGEDAKDVNV